MMSLTVFTSSSLVMPMAMAALNSWHKASAAYSTSASGAREVPPATGESGVASGAYLISRASSSMHSSGRAEPSNFIGLEM